MRCAVALSAAGAFAVSAAGCGGAAASRAGSGGTSTSRQASDGAPVQTARATPSLSNADIGGGQAAPAAGKKTAHKDGTEASQRSGGAIAQAPPRITTGHHIQHAKPTPATSSDDENTQPTNQPNPCALVTLREARLISNGAITAQVEAPLGPTCIYRGTRPKADVTLVVETTRLAQIARRLPRKAEITVGGRRGYCGRLGTEALYLPLAGGRLLAVTAPCPVARRFAAFALNRIPA